MTADVVTEQGARAVPEQAKDLAIEAAGLEKSYGDTLVLAGLDLSVPRGSLLALLGPNGAGKPVTGL